MTTSFFSGSCAIALTVLLSSFAAFNQPQHSTTNPGVQLVQDTVPRQPAGAARKSTRSTPKNQSATNQEAQRSDTRGEGVDKGRKGAVDTTNHGAVNTPE